MLFQLVVIVFTLAALPAMAADPDPQLDYCVGAPYQPCKDRATVAGADFIYKGLATPGNPNSDPSGAVPTPAFVGQFPALHILALSIVRLTYAPGGLVNIHVHPRTTEIVYVVSGWLYVGFSGTDIKLYDKILEAGHTTVIPRGLTHFSLNIGTDQQRQPRSTARTRELSVSHRCCSAAPTFMRRARQGHRHQ